MLSILQFQELEFQTISSSLIIRPSVAHVATRLREC